MGGVSFSVNQGEIVGLIGPNGAGKTTILNLISGVFKPDQGQVKFLDQDLTGLPSNQICHAGISRTLPDSAAFFRHDPR